MVKESYSCAILVAYRLYCKFIKYIDFNEFEALMSDDNYNSFLQKYIN